MTSTDRLPESALAASWKKTVASSSGQRIAIAVLQGLSLVVLLAGMGASEFAFLNLAYWGARLPQPIISFGLAIAAQRFVARIEPKNARDELLRSSTFFFIQSTLARLHLGFVCAVVGAWVVARALFEVPFGSMALFLAVFAMQALVVSLETFLFQGFQSLNRPNSAVLFGGLVRSGSVFLCLVIAFGSGNRGYTTFAGAYLVGLVIAELVMLWSVRRYRTSVGPERVTVELTRRALLAYGLRVTLIRIVNEFRNTPESFVIAGVFGLELSGILGGYRRLSASLQTVVVSLSIMTGTYASNMAKRDPKTLQRILTSVAATASVVALVGLVVTVGIGPFVFDAIFPAEFSTKLPYLYLMVGLVLGQAVAGNGKAVLEVLGQTRVVFILQFVFIALYWVVLGFAFWTRSALLMILAPGATTMLESLAYAAVVRRRFDLDVQLSLQSVRGRKI